MLPNEDYADLVDQALAAAMGSSAKKIGEFPFPRKPEPHKVVRVPTWRSELSEMSAPRLVRKATLRGVDAYFHKIRSKLRFASRPAISSENTGHTWDK